MPDIQFTFEANDMVSGAMDAIAAAADKAFGQEKTLKKFNAGLGQSAEITKEMGELARKVWVDGWGEGLEDVTGALGNVGSQMLDLGKASPAEIEKITKGALDLAEVMGVDVSEVTRAAGQMFKNGLAPDAQTALDMVARGYTSGADRAGDLLDVMGEYGPAFAALGLSSSDVLVMLNGALDAGAFNADKAADAINEFGIRAIDGSESTSEAFQALGFDAAEMAANIAGGGPKAQVAFIQILDALGSLTDPVAQETAGVKLFGSMWEDMGSRAILAMAPADVALDELGTGVEEMGTTLHDVATQKVDTIKRKFDDWVASMVATEGPFGNVMAFAGAFGPEALNLAGTIGLMALAFKGTAFAAGAAAIAGTAAARAISIAFAPITFVVGSVIALISVAIERIEVLKRNWQGLMSGNLGQMSSLGALDRIGQRGSLLGVLGGHAAGGITKRPHPAWVGEGGESELIMPLSKAPEVIGKALGDGAGAGGGVTVTVNVYGSVIQQTDLARAVQDAVGVARRQGAIPAGGF